MSPTVFLKVYYVPVPVVLPDVLVSMWGFEVKLLVLHEDRSKLMEADESNGIWKRFLYESSAFP